MPVIIENASNRNIIELDNTNIIVEVSSNQNSTVEVNKNISTVEFSPSIINTIEFKAFPKSNVEIINDKDKNIIEFISGATGMKGEDGREVELGKNSTHLLWRYVGDNVWINLISLTEITGPKGDDGEQGANGYTPYIGINNNWWINGVDTGILAKGTNGGDGVDGTDGKSA